jgi:oxalate decarboxylase/phosphoglucose isomerase-like protein (cupin superfamily)
MKFGKNSANNPLAVRTHEEMMEVLISPEPTGPVIHYFMIRGGSEQGNITIWQFGTAGDEYIKTYGHYHVSDFVETYKVLSGEGILLLQARKIGADKKPIDDEVEYVKAIYVKSGSVIKIPKYAGHLLANTGNSWLVTIDDSPVNFKKPGRRGKGKEAAWPEHADYAPVKKMRGFAYYIVKQNGKPAFIKNPNYRNTPKITIERT